MKKVIVILAIIILSLGIVVNYGYAESNVINPVSQKYRPIKSQYGTGIMYPGPCWIKSIAIYAPTAGDAAMIYNGLNGATAGIEFELSIGVNLSNAYHDFGSAYFDKGLYINTTDSDVLVVAVFDY